MIFISIHMGDVKKACSRESSSTALGPLASFSLKKRAASVSGPLAWGVPSGGPYSITMTFSLAPCRGFFDISHMPRAWRIGFSGSTPSSELWCWP